jgi:hypothetical protein
MLWLFLGLSMLTFLFIAKPQGPIPERISSVLVSMETDLWLCLLDPETTSSIHAASSLLFTQSLGLAPLNGPSLIADSTVGREVNLTWDRSGSNKFPKHLSISLFQMFTSFVFQFHTPYKCV